MNRFFWISLFVMMLVLSIPPSYSQVKSNIAFGDNVWHTKVGKQVQITTDVTNGQDRSQPFAYIVQIQNQDGVVSSLSWITGNLDARQSLSPSQSWMPATTGNFTAQIYVWASVDNPDALSSPILMKIIVS